MRMREIFHLNHGQSRNVRGAGLQYAPEKILRMDFCVQTKFNSP
jgi:hypothetical protein